MKMDTIDYYNSNADSFFSSTVEADMTAQYDMFENYLHTGALILDCGCGSGRDSRYFLSRGYHVTAMDGSEEMCRKAAEYTGLKVKNILFQDMDFENEFDGVWACASLLHVRRDQMRAVLCKICRALRDRGVLYASFKYGCYDGDRNGRSYTDMTEEGFDEILSGIPGFSVRERSITSDVRPGRDEKWLNVIVEKHVNS
ncbi:MAG: class I SAM-dependent methyltransferase [Lachnospiraceae bacterium]|nr:class I SAM-dependent methyltransferase [Lachnospiraceae bacterium]